MSIFGTWVSAIVADEASLSAAADLGRDYEYVNILIPTVDSTTIGLYAARTEGGTYYPLGISNVTAATTGGIITTLELGGFRYIKVKCGTTQTTAAVTFYLRGYRG